MYSEVNFLLRKHVLDHADHAAPAVKDGLDHTDDEHACPHFKGR